jgi:hypothetical protein
VFDRQRCLIRGNMIGRLLAIIVKDERLSLGEGI